MMQKRILVLDDDPDLLDIMDIVLTDAGYQILPLSQGDEIMKHIEAFSPDLILMDVMLDGMDGREICQQLKADQIYTVPIILISGTHNLEQVMLQAGSPNGFIAKPFDIADLIENINAHIV